MKLILTELQLNNVLINERMEYLVLESLNESLNFGDLKKKIKRALIAGISATLLLTSINKMNITNSERETLKNLIENFKDAENEKDDKTMELTNDSIFNQKVEACKNYMEYALKNQGYDWSSTKLNPEEIVKVCEENNFSLPFTMAIANLESCFGATPRAKRTNSVFSVGSYDNGKDVCTYSDPNESIAPFIKLLKNDYLIDNKTLDDILTPGKFVNMNGDRYATNTKYEGQVKNIMNRIIKMYPILNT